MLFRSISSTSAKEEFVKLFDSSMGTISNLTAKILRETKLLVKDKGKIKIHPALRIDFTNDFVVRFHINSEEKPKEDAN